MIVLDNFFAGSIPSILSRPILTTFLFFTSALVENEKILLLCDALGAVICHLSDDNLIRE